MSSMCVQRISAWPPLTFPLKAELSLNTHTIVNDIRQDVSKIREDAGDLNQVVSDMYNFYHFPTHSDRRLDSERVSNFDHREIQGLMFASSVPGVLPPPAPRIFCGREALVDKIVHYAKRLRPIALIGAGGIRKTSIILTALHDDRIKQQFGQDRRFIRCDKFPASRANFLRQLSKVVGAGIENPEDLHSLRPFLYSKEMLIVLDNAESILDPQGPRAREIYAVVDELTQLPSLCICITSRITTIPPHCKTIRIPTLSNEAAQETFYRIYERGKRRSKRINDILEQLDYHPLSITLLATVAQQSRWDNSRLTMEWERRRTRVLQDQYSGSLKAAIELSLASPMFRNLGPHARELLEVVAFFPQGINEMNTKWLFPTIPDILNTLDSFCALSLTYRNDRFVTMLAPLRDHLYPKDPASSPLLNATKENYFTRCSGGVNPGKPGFEEGRWITTEDANVEHLLDVLTTIDTNSKSVWDACSGFMGLLYHHKSRLVTLGPKIEALSDNHPSKPRCLSVLSRLFLSVGKHAECKRLLSRSLQIWREQGNYFWAAVALVGLSNANRLMRLNEEGIQQAGEASEIFDRLGEVVLQANSLIALAWLLCGANQLNAAEEAGLRGLDLLPEKGEEFHVCEAHRVLGEIYQFKGETKKAIHHFEAALGIASSLNVVYLLFWVNYALARLLSAQGKFDDAQAHLEHAKPHAVDNPYFLARAMDQQAHLWYLQGRFEDAKSEALHALDALEKLGAASDAEDVRHFLHQIEAGRSWRSKPQS